MHFLSKLTQFNWKFKLGFTEVDLLFLAIAVRVTIYGPPTFFFFLCFSAWICLWPLIIFRFDRDWKKIEAFVGSKTVIQVCFTSQSSFLVANVLTCFVTYVMLLYVFHL